MFIGTHMACAKNKKKKNNHNIKAVQFQLPLFDSYSRFDVPINVFKLSVNCSNFNDYHT